jgi:aminopeptidase N
MGYLGRDRSGTGVGMLFDYIIIHESGHEWFGNNITAKDVADNWIHEGFTTYTETLYAEWIAGKEKAAKYNKGEWQHIENDRPIIGAYGINDDGSGDKYDKGAAMLHMIRTVIGDDEKFRQILRGLNRDFWHQTVTTKQVEDYISQKSGYDFSAFFNQYLRTTEIPKLEWYRAGKKIHYRFTNVVPGFSLPVALVGSSQKVVVSEAWNSTSFERGAKWEDNFLIKVDKTD